MWRWKYFVCCCMLLVSRLITRLRNKNKSPDCYWIAAVEEHVFVHRRLQFSVYSQGTRLFGRKLKCLTNMVSVSSCSHPNNPILLSLIIFLVFICGFIFHSLVNLSVIYSDQIKIHYIFIFLLVKNKKVIIKIIYILLKIARGQQSSRIMHSRKKPLIFSFKLKC